MMPAAMIAKRGDATSAASLLRVVSTIEVILANRRDLRNGK
ncbi:MAG TPA: hypothetical protein VGC53_03440 [Vicinamibacteria bacterium]|jgi:hypothetical protein